MISTWTIQRRRKENERANKQLVASLEEAEEGNPVRMKRLLIIFLLGADWILLNSNTPAWVNHEQRGIFCVDVRDHSSSNNRREWEEKPSRRTCRVVLDRYLGCRQERERKSQWNTYIYGCRHHLTFFPITASRRFMQRSYGFLATHLQQNRINRDAPSRFYY